MTRLAILGSVCLVSLACAILPACGQQDETQRIIAQCGDPPPNAIDSCLEQARVQEETDPSAEMQKLVASLIKRQVEARNQPQDLEPPMPSDGSDPNGYDAPSTPPASSDLDSSSTYAAPPDPPPQDAAPPAEQGNPPDANQGNIDQPPPDSDTPNPPPNGGGPGGAKN